MIFARDKSQMCNNLLQYAHVYAWGRAHGRKVISMRFSYKYQYFRICRTSLTGFGWYLLAKYAAALKLLPTASFKDADCDQKALEQKMLKHRHIVVSGWNVRFRKKMKKAEQDSPLTSHLSPLRLGVHIRRGDYAQWQYGKYCFNDEVYARHINRFAALHPEKTIHVYLSTNDPEVSAETYQQLCPKVRIHLLQGSAPEDLYMLSACDYVMGPPSTFSLVAAMYRDIPLYRMDSEDEGLMTEEAFRKFDYWFRRII